MEPLVSIVIPCFNRSDYLKLCIDSILKQDYSNYEIIVVDDNSSEDIRSFLLQHYKGKASIKYLKNKRNMFPSFAKNEGALLSKGKYIQFVDSDTEFFRKSSISFSVNFLEQHKDFAVIGGEAGFDEYGNQISVHGVKFRIYNSFTLDIRDHLFGNGFKEVDVVDTSNMMIGRDILFQVGGFDPGYKYPHEDSDLCYRLRKHGYKIGIAFESAIIHKRTTSNMMNQLYNTARSRIRYQLKHFGLLKTRFYNVLDKSIVDILLNRTPEVYKFLPKRTVYQTPKPQLKRNLTNSNNRLLQLLYAFYHIHRAIINNLLCVSEIRRSRKTNHLKSQELINNLSEAEILC